MFPNLKKAWKEYKELDLPHLNKILKEIESNWEMPLYNHESEKARIKLARAFWKDTKAYNSWDKCRNLSFETFEILANKINHENCTRR